MNLVKDKIFLGVLACLFFIYFTFFLFQIDIKDGTQFYYFSLTSAYLIFFNCIIAAGFFGFGWIGGAIFLALSIVVALSLSIAADSSLYYIHIALFSITTFFSYKYLKGFVEFQTEFILKREKIFEERNTLSKRIEKDRAQTDSLELKFKRYEALKSVAEYLSDIFSQDKIIRFLVQKSYEIVGKSARSLIYVVDPEHQELVLIHSKQPPDFPKIKMKKGDMFDKWIRRQNQPLIVLDATKDFRFPQDDIFLEDINFRSLIAVPMVSHNKMIGLLRLDSQEPNIYNPDDLRLLDIIGDLGAVSLHNNMLYQRTNELAIRDGLTHLFVHRYFMERLASELQRALKKEHPLSILMIDIDYFKDYNDRYGHIAGDILLKHLSQIFTSTVSKGDIVARYGGEEFAIILFGEDKESSRRIAEKIREKVEKEAFYLRREKTHATVSMGISIFPHDAKTSEDLLKVADQNLYRAKREGRNRVCTT